MHTITSLRKTLGLSTTNQVRNRIEAIRDVLGDHLRRGPNNQILLTDPGLDLLRDLQELYDSGLTMAEASDVLRMKNYRKDAAATTASPRLVPNDTIPHETHPRSSDAQELARLRERIALLEAELRAMARPTPGRSVSWWEALREDLDGS